jgi:hypothetical protein
MINKFNIFKRYELGDIVEYKGIKYVAWEDSWFHWPTNYKYWRRYKNKEAHKTVAIPYKNKTNNTEYIGVDTKKSEESPANADSLIDVLSDTNLAEEAFESLRKYNAPETVEQAPEA